MPGIDWIPGVAQLKIATQLLCGDTEGAKRTNENFVRECPVVSQITSVVQLATGDTDGALETQKRCLGTVNNVANGIPGVGHVKGIVHHAVGDHEGGNKALNAASRSTVVIASGAAAGLATGGLGAIPAGIAAGVGYDVAATEVTGKDQGYVAAIKNAVDNPSAGAIFDAAVMPVGDGLAGYSGGQIATKITTQVKLSSLEAARAAKADQLNAALDPGATGGGGGMTSGQAITIGKEINALTSEINTIQQSGTPQYWYDPKTGEVGFDPPTSNPTVPAVPGYVDENNEREKKVPIPECFPQVVKRNCAKRLEDLIEEMSAGFEDAVDYDSYITETKLTPQQKQKVLTKYDQQKPDRDISKTKVPFTTESALSELLRRITEDPNRDPNNDPTGTLERRLTELIRPSWLPLEMPQQFKYTAAAQLNSDTQGLHHSFIRHMTQFQDFISFDRTLINRLSPVMREISALEAVTANTSQLAGDRSRIAREALRTRLRQLSDSDYFDVRTAFVEIQMLMHRFIQQNLTDANYTGRTVNDAGQVRLEFRVRTLTGANRIMVVCLSEEFYNPWFCPPFHNDKRPIRAVITVFFK